MAYLVDVNKLFHTFNESSLMNPCPDFDTISQYVDNKLNFNSDEYEHISSCQKCKKLVKACRQADQMARQHLLYDKTDYDVEQMVKKVRSALEKEVRKQQKNFPSWMKIAAGFLILCIPLTLAYRYVYSDQLLESSEMLRECPITLSLTSIEKDESMQKFTNGVKASSIDALVKEERIALPSTAMPIPKTKQVNRKKKEACLNQKTLAAPTQTSIQMISFKANTIPSIDTSIVDSLRMKSDSIIKK